MNITFNNVCMTNRPLPCVFKGKNGLISQNLSADIFESANSLIKSCKIDKGLYLREIVFSKPLHAAEALNSIIQSDRSLMKNILLREMHPMSELISMRDDLVNVKSLNSHKVQKLCGLGAFAFVFETENGDILKITQGSHFPQERKPDDFDLPIRQQGKSNRTFYYLEDKVTQDSITQEELNDFVDYIKRKGYEMRDYRIHGDDFHESNIINIKQFGKTKDGKLYLIDPGCALSSSKYVNEIHDIVQRIFARMRE